MLFSSSMKSEVRTAGGVSDPLEPRLNPLEALFNVALAISVTQVYRIATVELVIAFDRVLILAILCDPRGVEITETHRVGSQRRSRAASDREKITEDGGAVDLEILYSKRI